jgi:hypothetical protein
MTMMNRIAMVVLDIVFLPDLLHQGERQVPDVASCPRCSRDDLKTEGRPDVIAHRNSRQ